MMKVTGPTFVPGSDLAGNTDGSAHYFKGTAVGGTKRVSKIRLYGLKITLPLLLLLLHSQLLIKPWLK